MSSIGFLVLVREHGSAEHFRNSGEGPFDTFVDAESFVNAEVGSDYVIVEMVTVPRHGATGDVVAL
jgi:hypothetical protein